MKTQRGIGFAKWLWAFGVLYGVLLLLLVTFQERLMFFPDRTPMAECPEVFLDQGVLKQVESSRYYQVPAPNPQKGWIVYFHGNGGRACDRYSFMRNFLSKGYSVLLPEYPGYAEEGKLPHETELLASALASVDFLLKEIDAEESLILFGESLGTTVATYVASQRHGRTAGLILQAPFPSVKKVGQSRYFFLPVKWMAAYSFSAEVWARDVQVPVYAYHGTDDFVVPLRFGRVQLSNFASVDKTFWEIPDAGHINVVDRAGDELWVRLDGFLESLDR